MSVNRNSTDKPSARHKRHAWRVAVIANIPEEMTLTEDEPADAWADSMERPETIQAICEILIADGHQAKFLPASSKLCSMLIEYDPDICFNIAEGIRGDAREAQVPALLEMMGIPYTGSKVTANTISLNKSLTKRVWRDHGLPVATFQEFDNLDQKLEDGLDFPLFVKPVHEGSSMGISAQSVVHNHNELHSQIEKIIQKYKQAALVEEFLSGREFTVPILGREDARHVSRHPEFYGPDGFYPFYIQEIDTSSTDSPDVYSLGLKKLDYDEPGSAEFLIPAPISVELTQEINHLAMQAHLTIGALDVSRVDIRMNKSGKPCLMEINTLPGLVPGFSEMYTIAERSGLLYSNMILEILYLAASRYGLY